jgi:hypothetical protein
VSRKSQGTAQPTVEELIATLKKTSLPTIVVEGADDIIVYRRFEKRLEHLNVSVLSAGGRDNVLRIFARRTEIPTTVKLAFIVDLDTWIHAGVPTAYKHAHLVLTSGYSIENDAFVDGDFTNLLTDAELARFLTELAEFVEWYSLALTRHLVDSSVAISDHPEYVLNKMERPKLMKLLPGERFPESFRRQIRAHYKLLLRGKSLMALFARHVNYQGRNPRHSVKALLEIVAVKPGPLLDRLSAEVASAMST